MAAHIQRYIILKNEFLFWHLITNKMIDRNFNYKRLFESYFNSLIEKYSITFSNNKSILSYKYI